MRGAIAIGAWLCLLGMATTAGAEPQWSTYHRDPGRSGFDSEAGEPVEPVQAWQSPQLDGPIWGQPLVLGSRVYVATAADGVYALEAASGRIVWHVSAGTPVPSEDLPCGDIAPTVGIVGTPVIDTATKTLYAVADVWNPQSKAAQHLLKGYSLAEGRQVLSTPVDPPGAEPTAYLQRTALNLDAGSVIFGFGGNAGDCASYRGAVVAAPENGEKPRFWQYQPKAPSVAGGAVWGASGPIVGPEGDIFAATGNPNPASGKEVSEFDDSDAFLRLDPNVDLVSEPALEPQPLGSFEPPTWQADSNNDKDMGSAGPELLPGGLIFQAGKHGSGYLLSTSMHGEETQAVYEGEVCGGHASFGGDAFADGVIYLACVDGTQALFYNQSARTLTPLWQGPSDAFGPPILAAGLVWSIATGAFEGGERRKLYGLDPASGQPRYTIMLPSPVADHFASPSAAGGRLFVATGASVTAYRIAKVPGEEQPGDGHPSEGAPSSSSSTSGSGEPGGTVKGTGPTANSIRASAQLAQLVHRRLRASASGRRVQVTLRCPTTTAPCAGRAVLLLVGRPVGRHPSNRRVPSTDAVLASARFVGPAGGVFAVTLRLDASARSLLARRRGHPHTLVAVEIASSSASMKVLVRLTLAW